jgi:CRP-like cAMP-binding protein
MDKYRIITDIIETYASVSEDSIAALQELVHIETLPKNHTFIRVNQKNDYDYFLLSGICRSYIMDPEGEDITLSFFQDQTVLTPNVARSIKGRSTVNFQAISEAEIGAFKALGLVELIREREELRGFANAVLQKELVIKANKELYSASLSAKDRLLLFRKQYKNLENLVPHPYIASYLGITNISLSRLRGSLT